MIEFLFVATLAVLCLGMIYWGAKKLPEEKWQVLGTVPYKKEADGSWKTYTFTYYGALCATAYGIASALFIILSGAVGISLLSALFLLVPLLVVCMPLSRFVARVVEGQANTFTVGGAVFCGIIIAPWMVNETAKILEVFGADHISCMEVLAALAIAYCFGEGIGRLACLSFGCCYGKRMMEFPRVIRKYFNKSSLRFYGKCKKAVYEGKAEGKHLFPIQVVTAVIYVVTGLSAVELFLFGMFTTAMVVVVAITQLWRFFSEFFRADFRGGGKWSAYQYMALLAVSYAVIVYPFFREETPVGVALGDGLSLIMSAPALICLQTIWIVTFIYMGKSTVLDSSMSYSVIKNKV